MEYIDYKAENELLKQQLSVANNEITELKKAMDFLREQVLLSRHKRFGATSEKSNANQMTLFEGDIFDEIETESNSLLPEPELEEITYKRKKRKGKREQDLSGFPVEQIEYDIPENERCCPDCGGEMRHCGNDVVRKELKVIPKQFAVVEHVQKVYSCRHCELNSDCVPMLKAETPKPLIAGSGVASASFVADIANNKFALSLPLYRQEKELKNHGVNLSRQTMSNWLIYTHEHYLKLFIELLKKLLTSHDMLHGDETTVQVLHEDGRKPQTKSYMWVTSTSGESKTPIILFKYSPSRSAENPQEIFKNYRGYLHTDGYQAYRGIEGITVVGCFAHVRRYYFDAFKILPPDVQKSSPAYKGVRYCDALFVLERKYEEEKLTFDERKEQRELRSKPLAEEFFAWAESELAICTNTKSSFGAALIYTVNQKAYLMNYFLDGRPELSNNRAENAIRPFVVGRKNWLFCNTPKGADTSAAFYSIIETAKANGLKPYEYLKFLFEQMPNITLDKYDELLPWNENIPDICKAPVI
jgi:transposase/CRISPR/Cas system-associated protein endoribonuclease Cas2